MAPPSALPPKESLRVLVMPRSALFFVNGRESRKNAKNSFDSLSVIECVSTATPVQMPQYGKGPVPLGNGFQSTCHPYLSSAPKIPEPKSHESGSSSATNRTTGSLGIPDISASNFRPPSVRGPSCLRIAFSFASVTAALSLRIAARSFAVAACVLAVFVIYCSEAKSNMLNIVSSPTPQITYQKAILWTASGYFAASYTIPTPNKKAAAISACSKYILAEKRNSTDKIWGTAAGLSVLGFGVGIALWRIKRAIRDVENTENKIQEILGRRNLR